MVSVEDLITKIKLLPDSDQRRISALLGATVTDVATRPLHWIYNQDHLNTIIGSTTETEFWLESKCPFFTIPLGNPTAYNDTSLVCLRSLTETGGDLDLTHICESMKSHFGNGSEYADALPIRKAAYEAAKSSDDVGPIDGPWIHKAMTLFLENYDKSEEGKVVVGDAECKEYDIFCAALPLIVLHSGTENMWNEASKVVSLFSSNVAAVQMVHTSAMLVEMCIKGCADPLAQVQELVETLYPDVHQLLCEVVEAKQLPFVPTVATFGKACYMPGTFQGAVLAMLKASSFVDAVRLNISAGGCSGGRGNFIGAYFGAKDGIDGIPVEWLKKVKNIEKIMQMAIQLVSPST